MVVQRTTLCRLRRVAWVHFQTLLAKLQRCGIGSRRATSAHDVGCVCGVSLIRQTWYRRMSWGHGDRGGHRASGGHRIGAGHGISSSDGCWLTPSRPWQWWTPGGLRRPVGQRTPRHRRQPVDRLRATALVSSTNLGVCFCCLCFFLLNLATHFCAQSDRGSYHV